MKGFTDNIWDEKPIVRKSIVEQRALKQYKKNYRLNYFKAVALNNLCPYPKKGEQYRIVTDKSFNPFALVLNLLTEKMIDKMYLAMYSINIPTVSAFIKLIEEGSIKDATFITLSFFRDTKRDNKWAIMLRKYCDNHDNTRHAYVSIHAKVLLAKAGDDYYVFEGSGNMSTNARIEQYIYENNKEVFDFHKDWMDEIIQKGDI